MEDKIKKIMADVFLVDISAITEDTAPDNLTQWDSLAQLNLTTAIEEELGIELTEEQIIEMMNFKLVIEVVNEALKSK